MLECESVTVNRFKSATVQHSTRTEGKHGTHDSLVRIHHTWEAGGHCHRPAKVKEFVNEEDQQEQRIGKNRREAEAGTG
ncbi:hypothetical protein GUJ93_ZPchr0013g35144 [Zizania palustris]|uniref:Uncharacterized protein n=1 Tax=Zizania palustris TaxID=103762 RepID=A0A8J5WWW3_ZIZPA|nr:hypothetical protein GUJ93_ZPchr0013g35144 [Zizania palustris]